MKVFQVIKHGVTGGRDSGYPTETAYSPLFQSWRSAQAEADRLLERLAGRKTIDVMQMGDDGRYTGLFISKPIYEVREVPVLSIRDAQERQQGFIDKARRRALSEAESLEARARELRALTGR